MDNKNTSFSPKFNITNAITKNLTIIERARGFLQAAQLSEDWIEGMAHRAFILEAHHTTHIEGTRLTLEQAEKLLAGKSVSGVDLDDKKELLNYRDAFKLVDEYVVEGAPITEGVIREIHKRLVAGVRGECGAPGEYRKIQNYVVNSSTGKVVYTPPFAPDVPFMMSELVNWLNNEKEIHPILLSGIAQFQFVHIHPFLDGNGRTSRLLSTLCMYRAGYDFKRLFTISEYYDRDRTQFYRAIQSVRENGMDLTKWLEYFVMALATQMSEVVSRGEVTIKIDLLKRKYDFNERQISIIRYFFENGKASIADLEKLDIKTTRRTLQRDIKILCEKGILCKVGKSSTDPTKCYELTLL